MLDGILIECNQKETIQKSDKLPANTLIKLMKVIFIPLLFNKIEFERLESPFDKGRMSIERESLTNKNTT